MTMRFIGLLCVFLLAATAATAAWIKDQVVFTTKSVGTVTFSHPNHFDAVGRDCPSCHNKIFNLDPKKNPDASMADMGKGKSCGACHNGKTAFSVAGDCTTCHDGRDITFDNDGGQVVFSHDNHLGMFSCADCHPRVFAPRRANKPVTMEQMEQGKSCGACHNGNDAFTVADNCDSCHKS